MGGSCASSQQCKPWLKDGVFGVDLIQEEASDVQCKGQACGWTHMKGDILAYTSGACHSVRSSLWNPKGVSVRL